jgi:lysosomal Pro-X carboxypeptidase
MSYLTHEQAMADYATLIDSLQTNFSATIPGYKRQAVVLFGGSYGGMLAAWTRAKYPGQFAGAIAASAPIFAYPNLTPAYDNQSYWMVVTNDATASGGSPAACANNVRAAFAAILAAGNSAQGLANLTNTFAMCPALQSASDAQALALFHLNAWDSMAMGSYPYPSSYMTSGTALLPAYPIRAACQYLADPTLATGDPWKLLAAFQKAGNVFNNATANIECYGVPTDMFEDGIWDYHYCTELLPEETYFTCNGVTDMFYPRYFPIHPAVDDHCQDHWGVRPRDTWIRASYNPYQLGATNIFYTNGAFDPWSSGGVTAPGGTGLNTQSVLIPEMGHHVDLFFSNAADTPQLTAARQAQLAAISQWIAQHNEQLEQKQQRKEL